MWPLVCTSNSYVVYACTPCLTKLVHAETQRHIAKASWHKLSLPDSLWKTTRGCKNLTYILHLCGCHWHTKLSVTSLFDLPYIVYCCHVGSLVAQQARFSIYSTLRVTKLRWHFYLHAYCNIEFEPIRDSSFYCVVVSSGID